MGDHFDERYATLAEHVQTDTSREPFERESAITWSEAEHIASLYTTNRALARRWLHHEHIELSSWESILDRTDYVLYHLETDTESRSDYQDWVDDGHPPVVGIFAVAPITLVTVKSVPRQAEGHANITARRVLDHGGAD